MAYNPFHPGRNRLTIKQLQAAIDKQKRSIELCKTGSQRQNPQIIEMRIQMEGRLEAFEAVLAAMRGDLVFLNSFSVEYQS